MGKRQKPWQGKWIKPILCLETGYKIDKMQNIQPSDALSRVLHFFRAELTDAANFQINLLKKVGHSTLSSPLLSQCPGRWQSKSHSPVNSGSRPPSLPSLPSALPTRPSSPLRASSFDEPTEGTDWRASRAAHPATTWGFFTMAGPKFQLIFNM